ncbi:MAG TPA: SDR family oxidoreductase [Ktedonobacteraceae bacterium]|nr:SDR family oxidoreductase [Ktedonobacteraceae bacterium]
MARTIVITRAAFGIGKATAAIAEARGWQPIRVDLNGGDVEADLGTPQGRSAFVEGVTALVGERLDALIACAGVALPTPLTLQVNYFGAIATLVGMRPLLAKGTSPRAVGISSFASIMQPDSELVEALLAGDEAVALKVAESKSPAIYYASSKAALARWMRRQAITTNWAGAGILLNGIAPGIIETPMTQPMLADKERRAQLEQQLPMPIGRHGRPEEVAELLLWLASPANSLVLGQVIFIDGGSEATVRGDTVW